MGRRLTLVAGSGTLAPLVAAAARQNGDTLQIIDIAGHGDMDGAGVLEIPVARAEELIAAIRSFSPTHLVLAGAVHLSDADRERLANAHGLGWVARAFGDVGLAVAGLLYYTVRGIKLVGADKLVPDLLASRGQIAGPILDDRAFGQARRALKLARRIGATDLGQAVVVSGGRPVAAEDAGGTETLIARVAALREAGLVGNGSQSLILAKARKPRQPRFVDLPSIGRQTIVSAANAGIGIVAVEAGASLVLERPELVAEADARGVSVVGVAIDG